MNIKHSLYVLYELKGSTHLLCVVRPNPLAMADSFSNVQEIGGASVTGWIKSETIDICPNAKYMKEILLCITHLHHRNVTFTKNFKKFLQLVAPVFTFAWLC